MRPSRAEHLSRNPGGAPPELCVFTDELSVGWRRPTESSPAAGNSSVCVAADRSAVLCRFRPARQVSDWAARRSNMIATGRWARRLQTDVNWRPKCICREWRRFLHYRALQQVIVGYVLPLRDSARRRDQAAFAALQVSPSRRRGVAR
jgi:hypothetical protein